LTRLKLLSSKYLKKTERKKAEKTVAKASGTFIVIENKPSPCETILLQRWRKMMTQLSNKTNFGMDAAEKQGCQMVCFQT
jgi:hypothetical protein